MSRAAAWQWGGACAVTLLAAALYLPFLGNPLVFDDLIFFSGRRFSYYATHPLGLDLRLPAYFSLTMTEVLWGGIAAQRIVSLILHAGCALVLYRLLVGLQRAALGQQSEPDAALRSAIGAAVFALHPVTVYGAAYLVQRSIVLATLFSLLSAMLFLRGLRRGSHADALSAALFYSLAVLSKEHAILLPAAALALLALAGAGRHFALRHAAIYLAACAPAALFVAMRSLGVIGGVYEDAFGAIAAQIESASGEDISAQPLALSAVTQAGLFFKYLGLWLWPDTGGMSIDLRVDFLAGWSPAWIAAKVLGFAAFGLAGLALLLRRGAAGIAGFGMLYAWILFLVEFSAARFQEPFVLYRSYLWAPGFTCMAVALLARMPRLPALAAGLAACAILAAGSQDRLATFSSALRLWEDAAAKLPDQPVPWGSRTLYGAGREYLYAGMPDKAIEIAERCIRLYPKTVDCYYARGAIHLHLGQFEPASRYLEQALRLKPANGIAMHRLGMALEGLKRVDEAKAKYRRAVELGYQGAAFELQRLESPGQGVLAPGAAPAQRD